MKFSEYLTKIQHVEIYPLISLTLFVLFFLGVTWFTYRMKAGDILHHERLPLDK